MLAVSSMAATPRLNWLLLFTSKNQRNTGPTFLFIALLFSHTRTGVIFLKDQEHGPGFGISDTVMVPLVFPAIDNDLAIENIENDFDMTQADLQDLEKEKP